MAQITSREELEAWLKDKPIDFAQVIAARAALRVLPNAFALRVPQKWVKNFALALIRANLISWAAHNFPAHDMTAAVARAVYAADTAANPPTARVFGGHPLYDASTRPVYGADAADAAVAAAEALVDPVTAASAAAIWGNVSDCLWLEGYTNPDAAVRSLTHIKLWLMDKPDDWSKRCDYAMSRLKSLDQGYDVWTEWYNRRIRGECAAFDIPGDHDRTEDKKILARLADATNEDFWGKGATHVNTTLQSWIDEARERVRPRDAPFVTDPLRQLDDELQSLIDEAREQVTTQGEESAPEPQNADVIQFRQTDTGQFDPDFSAGSDELLTDQAACDRHHAFVTTARDALLLCRGHNQIGHVTEHLAIVIDAAGDQPRTMRVDLLVARGERMVDDLRDAINELQPDPEVALGNLREKRIVNVFNALIRDYTAMIKLDPALDRRQRLPHDDEENASAVSPQQALIFVNSSVTVGAITQSARDVIVEGARGLAEDGDVKDRKKWRFSETVRNLPRAMIGFLWQHRGGIVSSSVAGVSAVSMALITQEAAIRSFFATNPGMLSIIDELVGILRGIGM